jgi:hypothetical protein
MVEGPRFQIGRDALGHLSEQVVAAMNIAHAVNASAIRYSTDRRDRWRDLPERVPPPCEFGSAYFFGRAVHLGRSRQ